MRSVSRTNSSPFRTDLDIKCAAQQQQNKFRRQEERHTAHTWLQQTECARVLPGRAECARRDASALPHSAARHVHKGEKIEQRRIEHRRTRRRRRSLGAQKHIRWNGPTPTHPEHEPRDRKRVVLPVRRLTSGGLAHTSSRDNCHVSLTFDPSIRYQGNGAGRFDKRPTSRDKTTRDDAITHRIEVNFSSTNLSVGNPDLSFLPHYCVDANHEQPKQRSNRF